MFLPTRRIKPATSSGKRSEIVTKEPNQEKNNVSVILPYASDKEYYVEELGTVAEKPVYTFLKRAFDIVFALMLLVLLAVPMLVIAAIVKLSSKGPALYYQARLGLNGKPFNIIKFRTMYEDAEADGLRWSMGDDDPRITPVGRVLRKTHLDELPQLWCILIGDMSVVGPRPERPEYYDQFERYIHGFRQRLKVKPGMTGLAQVRGGYFLKPEEKILYDVEYIKNRSVGLDLRILFETVKVVFCCEGVK